MVALVGAAALLVAALDRDDRRPVPTQPVAATELLPTGRPAPEVVATVGNLRIQLPVAESAITAVAFHGAPGSALELSPLGPQANEGVLARLWHRIAGSEKAGIPWYQVGGEGTEVLDVGATVGADVYAPVDGTVDAITPNVVSGQVLGARIDIRPTAAPAVVLSLVNVEPDAALTVGTPVLASSSKLGTLVDIASAERQSLARVTGEAGNNVSVEVHPASGTLP